jgi:hypothetical protein
MPADAKVREHRAADVARRIDEVGCAPHSESEQTINVVHLNHGLLGI